MRRKISDPALAEEVLQDSLLKALRAAPVLREKGKLVPWCYRILSNAITDLYRRKHVEARYMEKNSEVPEHMAETLPKDEAALCACFCELIPTLKPEYAELIERLELSNGLYVTRDFGTSWQRLGTQFQNTTVDDILIFNRVLFAAMLEQNFPNPLFSNGNFTSAQTTIS